MKRVLLTTALAFAVSNVSAENLQMDPKDLAADMASQYIENINLPLPKIADVSLPEHLDMGLKKTSYRFESGTVIDFKTRDPLGRLDITHGNQNYQITQDSLTWSFNKVLNKDKFGQPNLQKFID